MNRLNDEEDSADADGAAGTASQSQRSVRISSVTIQAVAAHSSLPQHLQPPQPGRSNAKDAVAPATTAASSLPFPPLRTALWVLTLCTAAYFICQLQRWSLGVVARPLELRLGFGDGRGGGLSYQLLAGPVFNLLFTTAGVGLAVLGRSWSRTRLLSVGLAIGCASTAAMGLADSYATLALARAAQGLSQAGCSSFCVSLLSAAFPTETRSRALAVFNLGVYGGYSASFGLGNAITHMHDHADQGDVSGEDPDGYRNMFYIFALPSALAAILMALTVRDEAWEVARARTKSRSAQVQEYSSSFADRRAAMEEPLLIGEAVGVTDGINGGGGNGNNGSSDNIGSNENSSDDFVVGSGGGGCEPCSQADHSGDDAFLVTISPSSSFLSSSLSPPRPSAPSASPPPSASNPSASPSAAAATAAAAAAAEGASFFSSVRLLLSSPPLLLLCLGSSFRNGAGVTWGYNTVQFFESPGGGGLSPGHIARWMAWVPLVFGSGGAILGGAASDFLRRRWGARAQVGLLVATQIMAAPCAAAVLMLPAPFCFIMLFPTLLIGESYIGTCMAMLTSLSPPHMHSFVLALYIFCIANIGGNSNLLLPPLQSLLGDGPNAMRDALIILWPGFMVLAALCYATLWIWTRHGEQTLTFKRKAERTTQSATK